MMSQNTNQPVPLNDQPQEDAAVKSDPHADQPQPVVLPHPDPELEGIQASPTTSAEECPTINAEASTDLLSRWYVRLYRSWRQEWWWSHKPWSYAQLFMWFLMDANHQPRRHEFNGRITNVPRGSVYTSQLSLAKQSGLDRKTIGRFLDKMESSGELKVTQKGRNGMIVKVCKYETYVASRSEEGQRKPIQRPMQGGIHGTTGAQP